MPISNSLSGFHGEADTAFTGTVTTPRGNVEVKVREGRIFCHLVFKYHGKAFATWEMKQLADKSRWYANDLRVDRWCGNRAAESAGYVIHDHVAPVISDWCNARETAQAEAA